MGFLPSAFGLNVHTQEYGSLGEEQPKAHFSISDHHVLVSMLITFTGFHKRKGKMCFFFLSAYRKMIRNFNPYYFIIP